VVYRSLVSLAWVILMQTVNNSTDEAAVEFFEELIFEEYEEYRKRVRPYVQALEELQERIDAKENDNDD